MTNIKYYKEVTREEWEKTPEDYKGYVDGVPYMLMWKDGVGTIYAPVKIIEA